MAIEPGRMIELARGTELAGACLDVKGAISHTFTLRVFIRCCHLYQSLHVNMDSFFTICAKGAELVQEELHCYDKLWLFTRYVIAFRVNV